MSSEGSNTSCRLLIHPPAVGAWNMAVDEALLNHVTVTNEPVLRFYQWQQPTLSLGYFQSVAARDTHPPSQTVDLVRRLSGGGAILHDQELTYSLFLPASHTLSHDTQTLYDVVHKTIAATLNRFFTLASSSHEAVLCEHPVELPASEQPFLCFQRRSRGDITLQEKTSLRNSKQMRGGPKVVGSAQRRRSGVVLQHGSLLLKQSCVAPELSGIAENTHLPITPNDLLSVLPENIAQSLSIRFEEDTSLISTLHQQILDLQHKKYEHASWTERR